jgi:hypothetical protein
MKKYFFSLMAVAFAVSFVAFKNAPVDNSTRTDFYFEFTGSHGKEGDVTKWVQLADLDEYNDLTCNSNNAGCKIITTSVQTVSGSLRPSEVLTDLDGTPTSGSGITEIRNKP